MLEHICYNTYATTHTYMRTYNIYATTHTCNTYTTTHMLQHIRYNTYATTHTYNTHVQHIRYNTYVQHIRTTRTYITYATTHTYNTYATTHMLQHIRTTHTLQQIRICISIICISDISYELHSPKQEIIYYKLEKNSEPAKCKWSDWFQCCEKFI